MWNVTVRNVGGIESGEATIRPGLNVVQASNFQGKSSLVAALKTAVGATGRYDDHPLTERKDHGVVRIETDTDERAVRLARTETGDVSTSGRPYLTDDSDRLCARLFACLDAQNPLRAAVRNGNDLTDLIQAPLDTEDIDAQIEELTRRREELDRRIDAAEAAESERREVREAIAELEAELEELRERRETLAASGNDDERVDRLSEQLSSKSEELAAVETEIDRIEDEIDRKRELIQRKREEIDRIDVPEDEIDRDRIDALRTEIGRLETRMTLVRDLHRATQNVIEEGEIDLITGVDRSVSEDTIECWVCGDATTREQLEERVAELQATAEELETEKQRLEGDLEAVTQRQRTKRERQDKRDRLRRRADELATEITEKQGVLDQLQARRAELEATIEERREQLADLEQEHTAELADVKTRIQSLEGKVAERRERADTLEQNHERVGALRDQREDVREELRRLRTRKKRVQTDLRDQFNRTLAEIIEEIDPGFTDARLVLETDESGDVERIDLRVAREIEETGRQTSVETLSEGETELLGLVVALAGYRAFDVERKIPFILLDSVSELSADNLRAVASYISEIGEAVVMTAYPESGPFDGHVITPDRWSVVSDPPAAQSQ